MFLSKLFLFQLNPAVHGVLWLSGLQLLQRCYFNLLLMNILVLPTALETLNSCASPELTCLPGAFVQQKKKKHIKGEERMNVSDEKQFEETKHLYDPKICVGVLKLGCKEAEKLHKGHHLLSSVTGLLLHLVPRSPCCASGIHSDLVGIKS